MWPLRNKAHTNNQAWKECGNGERRSQEMTKKIEEIIILVKISLLKGKWKKKKKNEEKEEREIKFVEEERGITKKKK